MTNFYHSTLYVHGPRFHGVTLQQPIDAVFFPYLLDCRNFNEDEQPQQALAPVESIASVRIATNDPPAETLVRELSGKFPEHRFVLVKNDVYGADAEAIVYQAGRVASPIAVEPDHAAEAIVGAQDATATTAATSPGVAAGTTGLLRVAVQHSNTEYELSQHVFLWQSQYASTEFFRMTALAGEHRKHYETICDLLDDEDRLSFLQLQEQYAQRWSAFTTKREAADDLDGVLSHLREPWLVESLDHEGRESVSKAAKALQSVLDTLHLALQNLDINRAKD